MNKSLPLVDPDPGKCYTRAKKAKCVLCCGEDLQNTSEIQQPKEQVASIEGNWSTETSVLPKQFSFINIVEHAKKVEGMLKVMLKSLLKRVISFSLRIIYLVYYAY